MLTIEASNEVLEPIKVENIHSNTVFSVINDEGKREFYLSIYDGERGRRVVDLHLGTICTNFYKDNRPITLHQNSRLIIE